MNNMKTITKKSVRKIRDRVHYYLYIHPLKHSLAEDLQKKRIKITEKLTKEDVKNISSLWHPFNGRFDWDWFALYKSINISGGGIFRCISQMIFITCMLIVFLQTEKIVLL